MKQIIGKTDVGKVRERNEDFILVKNEPCGPLLNLFVLADGMGGHSAGNIASETASMRLYEYIQESSGDFVYVEDLLEGACVAANTAVHLKSLENEEYFGMGTTLTVCCFDAENLYYAHVGDSRIYLLRNGALVQYSRDHSLVGELLAEGAITEQEAREPPRRNVLTRAIGTDYQVAIDKGYCPLEGVSGILLSSDGLTDMLTDHEILEILQTNDDHEIVTQKLIDAANDKGGKDNISVIYIA